MSLTNQTNAKRILGIPAAITVHDDFISYLVTAVDSEILGYTGITALTQTTFTEKIDITSTGQNSVLLNNFPAQSVTALTVDSSLVSTDDYYLDTEVGAIRYSNLSTFFPTGRQVVEVTYVGGYSSIPNDLDFAAAVLVAAHFNGARHAGMLYEQVATYRYRRREGLPTEVISILARYRRIFARNFL